MDLAHLRNRVQHAVSAVPRLGVAAWRAGAGPSGTIEVLRISEGALRVAAAHGAGTPGRVNAMRHFMWQALLTARLGLETARAIGEAQEVGSPTAADSRVDHQNNAIGQAYGQAHAEVLRDLSLSAGLEHLVPVALEKWDTGELVWVTER